MNQRGTLRDLKKRWRQSAYRFAKYLYQVHEEDEILTVQQLADRLQVGKSTIYNLTRKRSQDYAGARRMRPLPSHRIGKFLRFSWAEVVEWLNETADTAPRVTKAIATKGGKHELHERLHII